MIHPHDQQALEEWAASKPFVQRMWVIGSRARGDHRPDSDLDVAIEIEPIRPGDATALASFAYRHQEWMQEIQPHLLHRLHLCHYNPDFAETFETTLCDLDGNERQIRQVSIVQSALRDGILIYDAAQAQAKHNDV